MPSSTAAYFAAGIAEAALTCVQISQFSSNNDDCLAAANDPKISAFTSANDFWVRSMIPGHASSTAAATAPANGTASLAEYWRAVGDSLAQFDGIAHGYDRYCVQANSSFRPLTSMQMMLMQMDGDLPDVESAVDPTGESARLHGGSKLGRRGRAQ